MRCHVLPSADRSRRPLCAEFSSNGVRRLIALTWSAGRPSGWVSGSGSGLVSGSGSCASVGSDSAIGSVVASCVVS